MGTVGAGSPNDTCNYVRGEPTGWETDCVDFEAVRGAPSADLPVSVYGSCPRCKHPISRNLRPQDAVIGVAGEQQEGLHYLMTCNCIYGHEGAPEGVHGCGAQGGVRVLEKDGQLEVGYVMVTPEQRDVEAWANDATGNRLAKTRAWAQQWMALLTAVTGFVSFGVIIDAAGDLGALSWGWRLLYAALGGMALASIVIAVVRAWQAANPIKIDKLEADCEARRRKYDAAVEYSATQLGDSYGWAVVGALLFAASMVIRVMTAPPPS